jgi:hypothetical protein
MLNSKVFAERNGPVDSYTGSVSGRKEIAAMGTGCPHTPARRKRTAARAEKICWGRNRLFLSPSRGFLPQFPPPPGQRTPPGGGLESRTFRHQLRCSAKRDAPFAESQLATKNEKFEDSIADGKIAFPNLRNLHRYLHTSFFLTSSHVARKTSALPPNIARFAGKSSIPNLQ